MWKNIVQRGRPQIIWRMRIACWIPKATNTHSEYAQADPVFEEPEAYNFFWGGGERVILRKKNTKLRIKN